MNLPRFDAAWTSNLKSRLVERVIISLKGMGGHSLLSGEDSGLGNVWDEICVQVQGEESFFWDTYVDVVDDMLAAEVKDLPPRERLALWLATDAGSDWFMDAEDGAVDCDAPPVRADQIIADLQAALLSRADEYEGHAVKRYLARQEGLDDDDDDNDDDEIEDKNEEDDDEYVEKEDDVEEPKATEGSSITSARHSEVPAITQIDAEALWNQAVAQIRAQKIKDPHACNMDSAHRDFDDAGKAAVKAAIQELTKLFGRVPPEGTKGP